MLRAHNMSEEAATEILDLFEGPEVCSALCCLVVLTVHYSTTLRSLLPLCVGIGAMMVCLLFCCRSKLMNLSRHSVSNKWFAVDYLNKYSITKVFN